jgi:hypothetical protein
MHLGIDQDLTAARLGAQPSLRDLRGTADVRLRRRSFGGVGDHVQAGRPKTIQPTLAVAGLGSKPGFVMVDAFLRAKGLERSAMPHHPELAAAVGAMILHGLLPGWRLLETTQLRTGTTSSDCDLHSAAQCNALQCTISMRNWDRIVAETNANCLKSWHDPAARQCPSRAQQNTMRRRHFSLGRPCPRATRGVL